MSQYFDFLAHKHVILVTHELSLSGAPLVLLETGAWMKQAGANVQIVNLSKESNHYKLDQRFGTPELPLQESFAAAAKADLVVVNTAAAKPWVEDYFRRFSSVNKNLLWWIHELDTDLHGADMEVLGRASAMVIDSYAALAAWEALEESLPDLREAIHLYVMEELFGVDEARRLPSENSSWRSLLHLPSVQITREEMRQRLGIGSDEFLLTIVGSIIPAKGQQLLVETLGQWKEQQPDLPLKLLVVGFGHEYDRRQFLDQLTPAQQQILPPECAVTKTVDLRIYYKAADALVMNSQFPGETFGRVTLEAMAAGLPVLGTDAGGTAEIVIPEETGLLYPLGKEGQEVLKAHIQRLLDDRGLARRLGHAGKERARNQFREEQFLSRFSRVVRQVVDGKKHAGSGCSQVAR